MHLTDNEIMKCIYSNSDTEKYTVDLLYGVSTTSNNSFSSTKNSALSRNIYPPLGEFSMSVLNTIGCTFINSLTEASIPFTDGKFLWMTVLCRLVNARPSSVFFYQCGRPMPLRMRVTACSIGTAFCTELQPAMTSFKQFAGQDVVSL